MSFFRFLFALALAFCLSVTAQAQVVGSATGDISNVRYTRQETSFGRLLTDSLLLATKADCALVNAGALRGGTLEAGPVERADLVPLLSFAEDEVVTLNVSGKQVRAALERAASVYPTGSPAFLHCAGLRAVFDPNSSPGKRLVTLEITGKKAEDQSSYKVAMPISLAQGAAGYFNIWNNAQPQSTRANLVDVLVDYFQAKKDVEPVEEARFQAQE